MTREESLQSQQALRTINEYLMDMYKQGKLKGEKQMKVPDKLFLHPNYRGEVGANWLTFPLTEKDECYIRKDALLEWVKDWQNELDDSLGASMVHHVLNEVIEKIESL